MQEPLALVQAPVLALLVQGLVQGLVPAQGPQVRPGLRVLRQVAVVLAFFSLSFFLSDNVTNLSPIDELSGATLEAPRGNRFYFGCKPILQDVDCQSLFELRQVALGPFRLELNH